MYLEWGLLSRDSIVDDEFFANLLAIFALTSANLSEEKIINLQGDHYKLYPTIYIKKSKCVFNF